MMNPPDDEASRMEWLGMRDFSCGALARRHFHPWEAAGIAG